MAPKQEHKQGDIGRRLMWTLLVVIAVIVVGVLFFFGISDPSKGPGNVPASDASAPSQASGNSPASK
ncbi:heme/copper-type cytochrome/quinol oxidase subunit 2 [Variovorax paradoxus]|uniref:hypothetical protein n=1 Tax=Variovorax paradoxus TaxID=34073 RepID=UPI002791B31E|nr:hypothetical protein [Variovorax paradoxus]MDQ0568342.1 heme/copper-type cytochrome/quinol oxidase subunit 2 [Variovorax paradoxus]